MEITVYADVLFAWNFFMDLIMLFLTCLVTKTKISLLRISASAGILALYGTLAVFPALMPFFSLAGRVAVSLLSVWVLTNGNGAKAWFKATSIFWLLAFALGGSVYALAMLTDMGKVLGATMVNGSLYLDVSFGTMLCGISVVYLLLWGFCRLCVRNFSRERICIPFRLTIDGHTVEVTALLDTGCELTVPLQGDAMMLVSRKALQGLEPKGTFSVGISTAGGAGSVLAFYPEKLECLDNRYKIQGIPALGMIQEPFSPNGRYEAVMNPDMVTEIGGGRHETTSHWLADFVTKNHRTIYKQTKKKRVLHRRQRNASATAQPSGGGRAAESLKQGRNAAGCTADFD